MRTERRDGFLLELGPNTVRPTPELLRLVDELGLTERALFSDPRAPRFLAIEGRLHALPRSLLQAISTPVLSPRGKARVAAEWLIPRRRVDESAGDESVADFFSRRMGREAAERLVAPFVSGVYAGDPARLSAEACFPALVRAERERGSLTAAALTRRRTGGVARGLLSFRDGLDTLPRAIAETLGDRLATATRVEEISPAPAGGAWSIRTSHERLAADRLILACPAFAAADLVARFAPEAAAALRSIPQPPVAVLHLAWPRSAFPAALSGFGHLAVPSRGRRILGAVWSSSLFAGRAPDGYELVTAFAGGATDPDAAALPDGALGEMAERELRETLRASTAGRVIGIHRWRRAIPQYEIDHLERMEVLSHAEARWSGLRFLGSYRGGISVGDVVRSALAAAER